MPGNRHRDLISSRRRTQDDGDEEEEVIDYDDEDSGSEDSIITGADADRANGDIGGGEDFDYASSFAQHSVEAGNESLAPEATSHGQDARNSPEVDGAAVTPTIEDGPMLSDPVFISTTDVDAMKNGLTGRDDVANEEAMHFDGTAAVDSHDTGDSALDSAAATENQSAAGLGRPPRGPRDDSEAYKAKRESNPAFVPTRGMFFMHDHRSEGSFTGHGAGSTPGRGRGRGRGVAHSAARIPNQSDELTSERWNHDLHDTVADAVPQPSKQSQYIPFQPQHQAQQAKETSSPVSLSRTVALGTVTIRALLPNMAAPKLFEKIPLKQYTRLPDLRPPLRRDKPVRVSLPERQARYIFPTMERSFIFIPRAQRPNQAGNRNKGRGRYSGSGSRRTSVYAGSTYTPSVAMSRRSSIARDGMISPAGSHMSRMLSGGPPRTIVKLPSAHQYQMPSSSPPPGSALSGTTTPFNAHMYPIPQQQPYRYHRPSGMLMHQPRPQKAVSVATIESPNQIPLHTPQQQEQQPFHHQVPSHIHSQPSLHARRPSFQQSHGTPLSNIPEGAINAQPFQPGVMGMPGFYPAPFVVPPGYYYPPAIPSIVPEHYAGSAMNPAGYVAAPGQYYLPMMMPVAGSALGSPVTAGNGLIEQPLGPTPAAAPTNSGMYAHESNGMVYYYDPTQLMTKNDGVTSGSTSAAAGGYAVPGAEGMVTPVLEAGYYYQQPLPDLSFYPNQP